MPTYSEQKHLPYSADQMFDLVMDVERYPEFLPWCLKCKILQETDQFTLANLVIGYGLIREWFTSKVHAEKNQKIEVEYINGPLEYLSNKWEFISQPDGGCLIDFYVDFKFKNPLLEKLMGAFFQEIVKRMVSSFTKRADELYGSSHISNSLSGTGETQDA